MVAIVDPRGYLQKAAVSLAPRPGTLDGKVIALLDNRNGGVGLLLDRVEELIRGKYEARAFLRRLTYANKPSKLEVIEDLVSNSDVVVSAIGD